MIATPLEPRHLVAANLMFVLFRLVTTCGVFMLVLAPFGVFESWWGPFLAFGSQLLVGMAFAAWSTASPPGCTAERDSGCCSASACFPLTLFSGAFFPIANLGPVLEWVAQLTPLWHGVNLSRMFCLDTVDWSLAAINVGVLVGGRSSSAGSGRCPVSRSGWWTDELTIRPIHRRSARQGAWLLVTRNYIVYREALEALPHRLPRAGLLPLLDRHRRRPADRRLRGQRPGDPLRRVRRARHAGGQRVQRRADRHRPTTSSSSSSTTSSTTRCSPPR